MVFVRDLMRNCKLTRALGAVALSMNCSGMYRGVIRPNGVPLTAIFSDEQLTEL
jgi:hypothetical protein